MKTIKWNGHNVVINDSIQSLPIWRFQLYTKYMVIDSGIGSDLADIDTKLSDLRALIQKDANDAIRQTVNIQQALHFAMGNVSPKMSAFVVLMESINGDQLTDDDLTDEGIQRIIRRLSRQRFSFSMLTDALSVFKKKMETEFEGFFPGVMDNSRVKEFYARLRQRTLLVLRSIRDGANKYKEQIEKIDHALTRNTKPRVFHGPKGLEVQMTKEFEATLVLLSQNKVAPDPRRMTTLAYYQALEVIKNQNKPKK